MSSIQILVTILVIALTTLLTRALPFLFFPEGKKTPEFVTYLGGVLPFAAIAMLVVYCFKSVSLSDGSHGIPEFLAAAFVLGIHKWKHNMLFSIGGGTVLYKKRPQLPEPRRLRALPVLPCADL